MGRRGRFRSGTTSAWLGKCTLGWRSVSVSIMVWFAAALTLILCLIWFATSEAAEESLLNCNEVTATDRCACNERILLALTKSRPIFVDPTEGGNTATANAAIIIQQHRQHRLRTFYAPSCDERRSDDLPIPEQHTGGQLDLKAIEGNLRPLRTMNIGPPGSQSDTSSKNLSDTRGDRPSDILPDRLLVGRWDGWQTLSDGKASRVSLHVISVDAKQRFATACSDQGMVFLRIMKEGYLEWSRVDSLGLAYSVRLWASITPYTHELEGVTLLEIRPGKVIVAGLVRLSRPLVFDWSTPPSSYFCQDRDLEEQRRMAREEQQNEREEQQKKWEEKERALVIQLRERIQQLQRELDAVRGRLP